MHSAKEKISNVASSAKEKLNIGKAKTEEKVEEATARTRGEKAMVHEREKAKEAGATMQKHQEKAEHAADREVHGHHLPGHLPGHMPPGATYPAGTTAYPPATKYP